MLGVGKHDGIYSASSEDEYIATGITAEEAENSQDVLVGEFPFVLLGMAQASGKTDGSAKIFIDRNSHSILGAQIRGFHAEELIRIISLAMKLNATAEDLSDLVYAHPTLPEAIGEAAESALGEAIHVLPKKTSKPEEVREYDIVVVGSGPAGYVAAIRAAQLGKRVAVIEKNRLGGTCLIRGCIPTKTILEVIRSEEDIPVPEIKERVDRVVSIMENGVGRLLVSNGITVIEGEFDISKSDLTADLLKLRVSKRNINARNVILSTGSESASLPGLEIDHENIIDSTGALTLEIPDELTIVGAGATGLEFAVIYKALGCKKVNVVEMREQICPGVLDKDMANALQKRIENRDVTFDLGKGFDTEDVPGGKVLIAVGRALNTQGFAEHNIDLDRRGSVRINDRYQVELSNGDYAENIFAIGDIVGQPWLAHKGSKEGKTAAEVAAKVETQLVDYNQIPSVIFTIPELATVGLTEEAAREPGRKIEVKYLQTPDKENLFKIIIEADTASLLGGAIIGPSAPYAIAEITLALRMGATLKQLMGEGMTLAFAEETSPSEWSEKQALSTVLTETHREAGAEMGNFHGWWVPIRFTDSYEEVSALRNNAAIWDIGYMAVLEVSGKGAKSFLQSLTTNDTDRLKIGQAQYSFFLDEKARPLDDVLVYRLWGQRYLTVVNAANKDKIKKWMQDRGKSEVEDVCILDLYDCPEENKRVNLFSLQGPEAENILKELTDFDLDTLEYFHFKKMKVAGRQMFVQRGGYSGEEGFEFFAPAKYALDLWQRIMEAGKRFGIKPAGLIARDIGRQEACLPLYGNEWPEIDPYSDNSSELPLYITPYEAGYGWAVKVDKDEFIGREAYIKHLDDVKQGKVDRYAQAAIESEGRWTAYQNYRVFVDDQEAGLVTSGKFSEHLGKSVWLAYVKRDIAELGQAVEIETGKERVAGKIVPKPVVNNIIYPRPGNAKENAKYYITITPEQTDEMLHGTIGVDSIDTLCRGLHVTGDTLPRFGLPPGSSQRKNYQYHAGLAKMNYSPKEHSSFLGAGSYDYRIPDVVDWAASLRGIYTPYTPYQAEVAQGLLRFFYIYQSQICQLTGMEVGNASLYDGATALAEAAFMSARITSAHEERSVFLVANPLHPFYYQVLETYARDVGCEVIQTPFDEASGTIDPEALHERMNENVSCIIVQQPNFFGQIENDLEKVSEIAHDAGALFISCVTDPHSLEILEAPAYYGADIAVGEVQPFGNPVNCGGPNLGFMAIPRQYMREIPGRIVGRIDTDGEETFCLIRQTREQHITRFKAKSNICSNTALCATRAALYMLAQGRTGLHQVNSTALALKEFFLCQLLAIPGFKLAFKGNSFNEVTVRVPIDPDVINRELLKRKCLGALNLNTPEFADYVSADSMLFSFTDRTTIAHVEHLIDALLDIVGVSEEGREEVLKRRKEFIGETKHSPEGDQRTMPLSLPQYSESDIMKFARDMADLNIDIDAPLYPLGSCTMKYNPKLNEKIAALEGFSRVHPLAPDSGKQGTLKLAYDFSQYLCQVTGMDAATLQPEAGAHGEFTGLKVIRAAHIARHETTRNLIITSDSSHGTNPASVAMAGMEILEIPSDKHGMIDTEAFRKAVEDNADRFAGCMLTIPNTLGSFEPDTPEICQITHEYGGYVYMDGANFNALIGQMKVRDLGIDVMHFNLHKTFGTPHGGGGPGAGPIAVTTELDPYLPIPRVEYDEERDHYWLDHDNYPHSVGKVSSFFGPYGVIIRANAYRTALGEEGMRKVSKTAILNANYMLKRIISEAVDEDGNPLFAVIYEPGQYCTHEFVISSERFEKHGLSAIDFAKGIIDFGIYAPTVGFPLFFDHGRHAIMVEPTETATRAGMDYFCDRFIELAQKAWEDPEILRKAPSKLRFRRINTADADRKLDVRSSVAELLPGYTPVSAGETVESGTISFVKRKIVTEIEGLDIPDIPEEIDPAKARFMEEGEWAFDMGDGFALCGLSAETVKMIKELKFSTVHLPKLGVQIKQGEDTGASVDFDKAASAIYAPVSGKVVKINPLLVDEENLDILISEPYKRGWLFVVQMSGD
ncbi:aminomethyl-transferring glycine dehydrogenase subunit GcvPB [Candidatus Poribacteria bacterium]